MCRMVGVVQLVWNPSYIVYPTELPWYESQVNPAFWDLLSMSYTVRLYVYYILACINTEVYFRLCMYVYIMCCKLVHTYSSMKYMYMYQCTCTFCTCMCTCAYLEFSSTYVYPQYIILHRLCNYFVSGVVFWICSLKWVVVFTV